ncbi:MAG TPA: YbaB/EbfC family nucleoid-associated protein [Acidimicrobiales bacterium]|nr:YbaB/EbfC family nucleoid-associated protein [Acidimicrobiales bacterium]
MSDQTPDQPGGLPDLGGLLGGLTGGGGGLGDLFAQAQAAMSASQAAASQEVEGSAGGGVVRIRATGGGEVRSVHIDPAVVDPDDVEGLEDLVLAALRDLHAATARLQTEAMGGFDPSGVLGGLLGGDEVDEPAGDADE